MRKETDKEFLERMASTVDDEVVGDGTPEEKADQARFKDIAQQLIDLRRCVCFFASVIKSGESWTDTCEKALKEALREPS